MNTIFIDIRKRMVNFWKQHCQAVKEENGAEFKPLKVFQSKE